MAACPPSDDPGEALVRTFLAAVIEGDEAQASALAGRTADKLGNLAGATELITSVAA